MVLQQVISSVEDEGKPIQALDVSRDGNQLVFGQYGKLCSNREACTDRLNLKALGENLLSDS